MRSVKRARKRNFNPVAGVLCCWCWNIKREEGSRRGGERHEVISRETEGTKSPGTDESPKVDNANSKEHTYLVDSPVLEGNLVPNFSG